MGEARSGGLEGGGAGQSGSARDKEVLAVAGAPPEAAQAGLGGLAGCWDPEVPGDTAVGRSHPQAAEENREWGFSCRNPTEGPRSTDLWGCRGLRDRKVQVKLQDWSTKEWTPVGTPVPAMGASAVTCMPALGAVWESLAGITQREHGVGTRARKGRGGFKVLSTESLTG